MSGVQEEGEPECVVYRELSYRELSCNALPQYWHTVPVLMYGRGCGGSFMLYREVVKGLCREVEECVLIRLWYCYP